MSSTPISALVVEVIRNHTGAAAQWWKRRFAPFRCVLRSQVLWAIPAQPKRKGGWTRSRGVAAFLQGWRGRRGRRRPSRWTNGYQRGWRRSRTAQMPADGRKEEKDRWDALSEWIEDERSCYLRSILYIKYSTFTLIDVELLRWMIWYDRIFPGR